MKSSQVFNAIFFSNTQFCLAAFTGLGWLVTQSLDLFCLTLESLETHRSLFFQLDLDSIPQPYLTGLYKFSLNQITFQPLIYSILVVFTSFHKTIFGILPSSVYNRVRRQSFSTFNGKNHDRKNKRVER